MEYQKPESQIQEGLISVIMSVYNTNEDYLRYAIESILNQSYTNFEFIIIDDGSTNDALSVIESYHDDRIILIKNPENLSLPVSLNKALSICKGEFVARFDSDDYSYSVRLEVQIQYMRAHPEVIVCGAGIRYYGNKSNIRPSRTVIGTIPDNDTYRIDLLFNNMPVIYHTTAMINRRLMIKYGICYDESKKFAQDYKLWVECSKHGDCVIIPEILVVYRVHNKAVSVAEVQSQRAYFRQIIEEQLKELHLDLTDENFQAYWCLGHNKYPYHKETKKWIKDLLIANKRYCVYNQKILKDILTEKWIKITYYGIQHAKSFGEKVKILFGLSPVRYPYLARFAFSKWYRKRG